MRAKKARKKVLSFVLALCMLVGILPTAGFAAQDTSIDSTATNVNTVKSYSAQMRKANTKTDYSEGGFTWDTERKKDSWRYFNGVMMDAFLMEGDTAYADAFYNSNINDDGTIKNYITGELDSVPTARGLFDLLNSSHKENYKKAIQYVYTQLEDQVSYDNCGGNYLHKQDTNGNPTNGWSTWNIGLDGLYMAQPFLMECANAIDNGTLTLTDKNGALVSSADIYKAVYERFAWVAYNMYDDTTGLYNHGWNVSQNKGNGHFWGRGIGWYAMALVDTISMMPATYQTQMQPYLTKLFDGMLKYQDTDTGMWYNVVNHGTDLSKNILETSVSSMMAYSLMKAYNKGYVTDAKYGQAGLAAFNGVVANKVTGSEGSYAVKDTYLKSGVGTSDSYYTANDYTVDEAKGTGALIMASTVAKDTAEKLAGTDTEQKTVSDDTTSVSVSAAGVTGITVVDKSSDETVKTVLADKLETGFYAYDITLKGYTQDNEATVTMPAPAGADKVYYVAEDSTLEEITSATFGDDTVTFTTTHFSTYAVGKAKAADSGVTVEGNPYEGLEKATDYPEYPADGAVRIDKTATGQNFNSTGVVQVELDTAGISVKKGVDVVLVVDVSNSMAWSLENAAGDGTGDAAKLPSAGQSTKLDNAMDAADSFSKILLEGNTGAASDNSVSFVTFAGYDKDHSNNADDSKYVDSVKTVFTNIKDYNKAATSFAGTSVTGTANGTGADYNLKVVNEKGETLVNGGNRGNTNYDYAFYQAQQAVTTLQAQYTDYANSGRETYVVFMTDGAPSHYNKENCNGGSGRDYWPDSTSNTYNLAYNTSNWTDYITQHDNTYANTLYQMVGGNFYAFGFDLANGGFSDYVGNEETLTQVLAGMVAGATIPVMATSDKAELTKFYKSLATQIKYAGTNARVTDTVDSNFTLQTTSFGTDTRTPSAITVTAYDLYTKAETDNSSLIGTRKGTSTKLETVTFNEDGTEAYSDKLSGNIMTTDNDGSVTITAQYFTYTKDTNGVEKFVWNIGDITDKEVALSYYAYLKGSMEGTCTEGVYYTNEGATLEYVDINGKYATKEFPKPNVNWGGAITTIEYYLVNENGEPVNSNRIVIPFANRIKVGDATTRTFNWNESLTVNGSGYVPAGYEMYNTKARYTVKANSDGSGSLEISDTKPIEGSEELTTKRVDTDTGNYASTAVAFGVLFKGTPVEKNPLTADRIVIDYGKAIQADITSNEDTGAKYEVLGFVQYKADTNVKLTQFTNGTSTFNGDYGQFTIVDGKVQYQPKKMLSAVEKIFAIIKVSPTDGSESYRMLNELDIIPATSVYYETDFADGVFTMDEDSEWKTETVTNDTVADGPQDDGTIGKNQYGYDSSYTNDKYQSDSSSYAVTGQGSTTTTANFSFTGTGFDIISRTDKDEGFIRVSIYEDAAKTTLAKRVTVLNKSESDLTLYQIPVVSVEKLEYGTYYVEIGVSAPKESKEYPELSNQGKFHFDAIRIYNPINASAAAAEQDPTSDAAVARSAYIADGEADVSIQEIRQKLITSTNSDVPEGWIENGYDETTGEEIPGVVFVDRNKSSVGISDYETIGPNNEVYLTAGQTIGFKLTVTGDELPTSIDVGAKSADGRTVYLNASVYTDLSAAEPVVQIKESIASSTAQFYDLLDDKVASDVFGKDKTIYVLIDSCETAILSITDLKVAYGNNTSSVSITSDTNLVRKTATAPSKAVSCDVLSADFTEETIKRNRTATMNVVTEADVETLKVVNQADVEMSTTTSDPTINKEGNKEWTVTFKVTSSGTQKFTVTGYAADGTCGASVSDTIKVKVR